MKKICYLSFLLFLASSAIGQERQLTHEGKKTTDSERRVALVIGNSAYGTAPLKNPVNDAQDMARVLRGIGFDVIHRENLTQNEMKRAIREFGAKIRNGGVGLFYYAGHGVAVKGINYLVPIDATVESEEEVEYESVDAGFVLAQMDSAGNRLNIVILDACRNNPFARSFRSNSRGLAQMDAPSGTLIAYATAPGSVASDGTARNGLYTEELLKFVQMPNLGIEEVFKRVRISVRNRTQSRQTPWESSSLTGDFYFGGSSAATNNPSIEPPAVQPPSTSAPSNSLGSADPERVDSPYKSSKMFGYTSPAGRYYVLVPAQPNLSTQQTKAADGSLLTQHLAQAADETTTVNIAYFDYPGDFNLDKARDGMVTAIRGTLLDEHSMSLGGAPGRQIKIAAKTEQGLEFIVRARFYDVKPRAYVIQCLALKSLDSAAIAERCEQFFDSFRVRSTP